VKNALKFSKFEGQVKIYAAYYKREEELRVMVKDTGMGISQDYQNKIFNMFGLMKRTAELNNDGIGLGLSISKQIIDHYKGKIIVHSEGIGKGASFMFCLKF